MTLTRIIGDVHGKFSRYIELAESFDGPSIQIGDFGVGFGNHDRDRDVAKWQKQNPQHRFYRGNHDNPETCKQMPGYISDGTVENDLMIIGGAWSIDYAYRTIGLDWWDDEELSQDAFDVLIDTYRIIKPRVMLTHDCPQFVSKELFIDTGLALWNGKPVFSETRTGMALQAMFEIHQPEEWYFGHWHNTLSKTINGTRFQCIGELDYVDVEL